MMQINFFDPIEDQIKPPDGNRRLVNYGIQNDGSDYRAHVGYQSQHVMVFPTKEGFAALERDNARFQIKEGSQRGVEHLTFRGIAMPISSINHMQEILIPIDIYQKHRIVNLMDTSQKGFMATIIVYQMIRRNLINLPVDGQVITDKDLQVSGTDITVRSDLKIQVKCDFKAGPRIAGGTGNVFLQIAECNPRKNY